MAVTQIQRGLATGRGGSDVTSGTNDNSVSQREDLASFISMITRDETPFMSSIGKTKCSTIYHEWQTDTLAAPGNSRVPEGQNYLNPGITDAQTPVVGDDFNIVGPNRTRLGNYCQINAKTIAVSGTRRAIDQAGVADEYAYQLKKRGTEMRRDVEHDLVNSPNVSSANGTPGTGDFAGRTMGTIRAWLSPGAATVESNGIVAVAAADQGAGTTVSTTHAGTSANVDKVGLSLADIDAVMQSIYEEGGKATRIMVSPKLRRDFSDLLITDTGVRRNIDEKGKLRQSVDVYMSDFGDLMIIPNYIMGLSAQYGAQNEELADEMALVYDPQWFSMATLRPMQEVQVGQQGDSTVGMFVEEQTFLNKNPIGCGAIYNLA